MEGLGSMVRICQNCHDCKLVGTLLLYGNVGRLWRLSRPFCVASEILISAGALKRSTQDPRSVYTTPCSLDFLGGSS